MGEVAVGELIDGLAGELRALSRGGWGVTPRHSPGAAGRFAGLLSTARLQQLGSALHRGAPLLLAGLDEHWPPAGRLCQELSRRSGLEVHATAVAAPAGVPGAGTRVALADLLVLQCSGRAGWSVWPPTPDPTPAEAFRAALAPGDSLYVPRGAPHRVEAGPTLSVHVTLVLGSPTLAEVAERAARERGAASAGAAGTLPPFWFENPGPHVAAVRRVTDAVLAEAAATVPDHLAARAERLRREALNPGGVAGPDATGLAPAGTRPGAR
jgi:hypothetical protein